MSVMSIRVSDSTILEYLRQLPPRSALRLEDLKHQAIINAILKKDPNFTQVYFKGDPPFPDNIVWFYGTKGDARIVITNSFLVTLEFLQEKQPKIAKKAIKLLAAHITTKP